MSGPASRPPGAVTRWYRSDWQYAVDKSRLPLIGQASATIAAMPALVNAGILGNIFRPEVSPGLWLAWAAAVTFLLSYTIAKLACPKFVQEYRDYGEYRKREHSHRWVIWEIYNNIERLSGWQELITECLAKGIADQLDNLTPQERTVLSPVFSANTAAGVRLIKPVNHLRHIYLPVERGSERIVIFMREDDTDLDKKEKEAFWILYSQAVKERPKARVVFWILWYSFVVLGSLAIIWNFWSVLRP